MVEGRPSTSSTSVRYECIDLSLSVYKLSVIQDSLLATPLILDLTILTELLTRVKYRAGEQKDFAPLYPVLSLLSYMCKAPLVKPGMFGWHFYLDLAY